MTPARKLTHNMKFEHFLDAERHEFWEHHNYSSPWAREMPKPYPERHEFQETALIDPSEKKKMPTNKESIRFSRISHHN